MYLFINDSNSGSKPQQHKDVRACLKKAKLIATKDVEWFCFGSVCVGSEQMSTSTDYVKPQNNWTF